MRLWHYKLIPFLPQGQLLGQHRECCTMRGKSWGRNHYVVNYVWNHDISYLFCYHILVMCRLSHLDFNIDDRWYDSKYRGKNEKEFDDLNVLFTDKLVYPEHDEEYLSICLHNLKYSKSYSTGKPKNIDLFGLFKKTEDIGCSMDDYEKRLRKDIL